MQKFEDTLIDLAGNIVAGAQVRVTSVQTGGLAVLRGTSGGAEINNPLVTGPRGEYSFYAANGRYRTDYSIDGKTYEGYRDILLFDPADDGASAVGYGNTNVAQKIQDFDARLAQFANVTDPRFAGGAKGGGADDTAAFNAAWQYVKDSFVDVSSEDYVSRAIVIPPGVYDVSSIDFTGLKARNVHVIAWGAVIRGNTAGKNVVDLIGTRWVQIHGLTVFGREDVMPKCGILIGPESTAANGNNYFHGVNVTGHFTHTSLWNIGSETTTYVRSRFSNSNTDPAALCYIADGCMRKGASSDYQTLRAAGVAVSFTNNQFYSCDVRNTGGGSSVYLEYTRGWGFDRGCYFISFNAANFLVYVAASSTHQSLSIEGLMESAHVDTPTVGNTGCKYNVEFVGDGTNCLIEGFVFKVGVPHSAIAAIKTTGIGALNIKGADVVIGRNYNPGTPVFSAPNLTLSGRIHATVAGELNLNGIAQFNGSVTVDGGAPLLPPAGAYTLNNTGANRLIFGGSGPYTQDGVWRAEGAATDVDWKARAKGDGDIEMGNATKADAFRVDIPPAALHGFVAYAAGSGGVPYYGVRSATAAVNIGLRSKGANSSVQIGNDVAGNSFLRVFSQATFPRLMPEGDAANIDLQIEGKGTGGIRLGGIQDYADDTAAAAGGIPVGRMYRTGSVLKVRVV